MAWKPTGNPPGCPPKYKNVEEITGLIEDYFKECEGTPLLDKDGQPRLDKWGQPIYINRVPPTVTGLALALGFNTRIALLNYQGKKAFANTITRAKAYIEAYAEGRLFDRDGTRGAQFSLTNNFKGWKNNPEENNTDALDKLDSILKSLTGLSNRDD